MKTDPSQILAVIPARGGSKGLPGKNTLPFLGRPLLEWSVRAAKLAGVPATQIVLSTDDADIAVVGTEAGASVPFLRPAELAHDTTATMPVLQHALQEMEDRTGRRFDWILTLQPTSPLRLPSDLTACFELLDATPEPSSVISVVEMAGEHPVNAKYVDNGRLKGFPSSKLEGARRQDCEPTAVFNNGAIYLTRRDTLMEDGKILGSDPRAHIMPKDRSIDIDDRFDFSVAEYVASTFYAEQFGLAAA